MAGVILLCLAAAGVSAVSNAGLPARSEVVDRLSEVEKARLAEAIHLRQALGDSVWPQWGQQAIPLLVYNEAFAFLVGVQDPPAGWVRMPQNEHRGGSWEAVPNDLFEGQVYYRQPLPDPAITPENFTVRVGDQWVATMMTKEYAEVAFYDDLREQLPPGLNAIMPYRLMWNAIMGDSETYIGGLEHESFHALQGTQAAGRLAEAETANRNEADYPWDDAALGEAWKVETHLLVRAIRTPSDAEAAALVRQFLAERDERRATAELSPALVDYERQREWLEGLAKYAELAIQRQAASASGYTPLPALAADPDFKAYATREQFWSAQLGEVTRTAGREGETRFYYSGMAQAVLLDRLLPGWKERAFDRGVTLEDLLREA